MKKLISILLCLLLACSALPALAANRILRDNEGFYANFDGLDGAQSHTLALLAGDSLSLADEVSEGTISLAVHAPTGILYETADPLPTSHTVEISQDGEYRIDITGKYAVGNVWIQAIRAASDTTPPSQLAQSSLGYAVEYDPGDFTFESYGTFDYFMPTDQESSLVDTFLIISMQNKSAEALAAELLADADENPEDGTYVALAPQEVDSYTMQTIRFAGTGEYENVFYDYYLIALDANRTLYAQSSYTVDSQAIGRRMQSMVEHMFLTK